MLPSLYYDARWKVLRDVEDDKVLVDMPGLSSFMRAYLARRCKDEEEIFQFLNPKPREEEIPGTAEIAKRLVKALEKNKKVLLFGDYDVDGLSALALMIQFLKENGHDPAYYVPSRYAEGYGLTMEAVEKLPETDVLLTFDCGITSVAEVEALKEKGVEVLITDHHQPVEVLPDCPILNPQLTESYRELAGVGVAYKLASFLSRKYGYTLPQDSIIFAMLGTVCDLMPLQGENRWIVREGLKAYEKTSHPGLLALRHVAQGPLSAEHIGFRIGPLINAAGRLQDAGDALNLLLGKKDSMALAQKLSEMNLQRKEEEGRVVDEALKEICEEEPLLLVSGSWKKGVLGLAASRLAERYRKPAIVLDQNLQGSSRSVGNFSIINALENSSAYLDHFGGHIMAAGLQVKEGQLEAFKEHILAYTHQHFDFLETRKCYEFLRVEPGDIHLGLLDELELLSPYGIANPRIIFELKGLKFLETRELGSRGRAFKSLFKAQDRRFEFIYFDSNLAEILEEGDYDVLFTLSGEIFRDILSLKLQMKDVRPSRPKIEKSRLFIPFYEGLARSIKKYQGRKQNFFFPEFEEDRVYRWGDPEFPEDFPHPSSFQKGTASLLKDLPDRENLKTIYTWLKRQGQSFSWRQPKRPLLAMISLIIFEELDLLQYTNRNYSCHYQMKNTIKKINLDASVTYRQIMQIREDIR